MVHSLTHSWFAHTRFSCVSFCAPVLSWVFACVLVRRKLTAELDAIPAEMEALDGEIARAEHLAAERLLERLLSDVEVGMIGYMYGYMCMRKYLCVCTCVWRKISPFFYLFAYS